ncbi:MAG: hypothetical protein DMG71_03580 [Acidobacteria bacterium]|nr:MAG: hypothetical protein DMG71_03580 [Acidobacteriota bacterium]
MSTTIPYPPAAPVCPHTLPDELEQLVFSPTRSWTRRILPWVLMGPLLPLGAVLLDGFFVHLPGDAVGVPAPGERLGVIHVHTAAGHGSGTLPQVISAARDANLSFLAVTDHNITDNPATLDDPSEFAVIAGNELSTSSGHFLALGVPPNWPSRPSYDARTMLAEAHAAGGVTFLAHPYSKDPWSEWGASDFDGMEIWNEDAVWRRNTVLDLLISAILYPVNNQLAMLRLARTPEPNLAKWDELLAQRPVAGICGADAHAAIHMWHGIVWRFPEYLPVFRLARQHVLLGPHPQGGDPRVASATVILDALKRGHSFCALDAIYPASGFVNEISSSVVTAGSGDFAPWTPNAHLRVIVPSGASLPRIKVYRDGHKIVDKEAWSLDEPLPGPGCYRSEVYLRQPGLTGWHRWTLWIFSNPIYVTASSPAVMAASN